MVSEQEIQVSFFRFEDLRIYAKALDYISWVHNAAVKFPENSQVFLAKRFVKSAQAIALNISEGSARNKAQFIYYLKMAKSAVRECVVYTEMASNLSMLSDSDKDYSRNQLMELTKMIGSLVASLQRTLPNQREEEDEMETEHISY